MVRKSLIYLISFLLVNGILCIPMNAQNSLPNSAGNFRETVWLQTNRHLYLSGERITYHATVLERDSYKSSVLSKNIRIELADSAGNILVKMNLELGASGIEGTLPLASDLKSGWYYLRAYTNWMRNFPESEYTLVPVKVINSADLKTLRETLPVKNNPVVTAQNNKLTISASSRNLIIKLNNRESVNSGILRLLVHRSGTCYWSDNRKFADSISFSVPLREIPEGIVQFSLLADDGSVIARRLWNNSTSIDNQVKVTLKSEGLKLRSQLKADYQVSGLNPTEEAPVLSAVISLSEPNNPADSYIPGMPGWPCNWEIPAEQVDFEKWLEENAYADEIAKAFFRPAPDVNLGLLYLPETRTSLLSGRVINQKTGTPVPEAGIGVTLLAENRFNAIKTNKDGLFFFTFPEIKGPSEYILSFISEPDSVWSIEVFSEFDKRPFKPQNLNFTLSREELEFARDLNTNQQLTRIYSGDEVSESVGKVPVIREKPFYDPPDRTIFTDNYIELANVGEVVYEVVPNVQVHREGNKARISVYSIQPFAREYETLVLLDGIPLTSQKELLDLPPGRIKSIDVRNNIYIHGNYIFSAVVNFISRNGDFAGLKLPARSVQGTLTLPVSTPPKRTTAIKDGSAIPNLNPLLLWKKGLKSDTGTVEFSVKDLYGDYSIRIYGFDKNGRWMSGKCAFKVTPQSR